jgi:regulator of cell morphogenesis and NO signaling
MTLSLDLPTYASQSLARLATQVPGAALTFQRLGLDFCCGGQATLADACATRGLDLAAVEADLRASTFTDRAFVAWELRPLGEVIDHVLAQFHERHRAELPPLILLARRVEERHADKAACPRGLAEHLEHMAGELELHMQKEEQVLFPLIRQGRGRLALMPIQVLEEEHKDHARALARLRELAGDYVVPPEGCTTWTALYLGLAELERALFEHIHLENNVLFPRAARG